MVHRSPHSRAAPGKARRDDAWPGEARRQAAPGKLTRSAAPPPSYEAPPRKVSSATTLAAAAGVAAAAAGAAAAAAGAAAASPAKRSGESAEPGAEPKRRGEAAEPRPEEPKRRDEATDVAEVARPSKHAGEEADVAEGAPAAPALSYHELDEAFEKAGAAQGALMDRRAVGVREVLGNLEEADPPSLADELLKTLAVAALGAASGYVTAAIADAVLGAAAVALTTAVQSGLDDGLKDAATKIAGALASAPPRASRASFFAGQEDGLVSLRAGALRRLAEQKRLAKEAIEAAPNAEREAMLAEIVAAVRSFDAASSGTAERGRQLQYQASLSRWLSALAQAELGQGGGGAELGEEVAASPDQQFREEGVEGVVYLAFGQHPAELPLLNHARVEVSGLTDAAHQRVADVPLRELGLPVVATGYVCDGFLDTLGYEDNEVGFGRNEAGAVWLDGEDDGLAALGKAGRFTDPRDTVEQVLREEVDVMTLARAKR